MHTDCRKCVVHVLLTDIPVNESTLKSQAKQSHSTATVSHRTKGLFSALVCFCTLFSITLAYIKSNLWSMRENTSAMAAETRQGRRKRNLAVSKLSQRRTNSAKSLVLFRLTGRVGDHADGALHLGKITAGHDGRGLVVDTAWKNKRQKEDKGRENEQLENKRGKCARAGAVRLCDKHLKPVGHQSTNWMVRLVLMVVGHGDTQPRKGTQNRTVSYYSASGQRPW